MLAHRRSYEQSIGEIPPGLEIDHLCRNRKCVNPQHMEPVTRATNTRRGNSAKLTLEKVKLIRVEALTCGGWKTARKYAAEFSMHPMVVWYAIKGKTWVAA